MIETLVFVGLFGAVVIFALLLSKAMDIVQNIIDFKRKKAHPELFKMIDECHDKGAESAQWYNAEVAPLKRKIDALLDTLRYCSNAKRVEQEEELEELRTELYEVTLVADTLDADWRVLQKKIHKYVEEHDLEWARKWGW